MKGEPKDLRQPVAGLAYQNRLSEAEEAQHARIETWIPRLDQTSPELVQELWRGGELVAAYRVPHQEQEKAPRDSDD
jgi:hypothetical protein